MAYPKKNIPLLPIKNSVLFPYISMPLVVSRPASVAAIDAALGSEDKLLAVFTQKDATVEEPKAAELYDIGTLTVIKKMTRIEHLLHLEVLGITRVERLDVVLEKPYLNDMLHYLPEQLEENHLTQVEALYRAVIELANKLLNLVRPELKNGLSFILSDVDKPLKQIYFLTTILTLGVEKEMALLAAKTQAEVFTLMHDFLKHEVQVLELRNQINSQVQSKMGQQQREYLLRQQLSAIQEELGEQRPEQAEVSELRLRLKDMQLPENVLKEVEKELQRLERMSSVSPDYQLTRTYLELALELPWDKTTDDQLDLDHAQNVLDQDHFDLKEVKQRILEHLAVMQLNPEAKAPILCFVGPPGVGKTSLGQSIARAMGRKFERMSLGGYTMKLNCVAIAVLISVPCPVVSCRLSDVRE